MAKPSRKPSQADVIRLGADVAAYKAANPRQWRQLVKTAHSRGYTVAGQLSGVPDPLKERTRSSLQKQALTTVNSIYKPQEAEMDQQAKRVAAIDSKRSADESAYQQWLQDQRATLTANARAADAELASRTNAANATVGQNWAVLQQQARTGLAQTPGTVSDPAQARALDLSADAAKDAANVKSRVDRTNQQLGASAERVSTLGLASLANGQAQRATIQADTAKAYNQLSQDRFKLKLNKAADATKEATRLFSAEVDKANSNREFGAAAEKLGLATKKLDVDQQNKDRQYKLQRRRHTLAQLIASNREDADDARVKLGYDKLRQDKGKAAADRKLKRELEARRAARERSKKSARKITPADRRASADAIKTVSRIQADIARLHQKNVDPKRIRALLVQKGASGIEIDVANDLWRNKDKLSPAGRRKAVSLGIIIPEYWR